MAYLTQTLATQSPLTGPVGKSCCPEGSLPNVSVATVPPKTITMEGLRIYEAGEGPRGIVIASDIFGLFGGRSLEYTHRFAEQGFHVFFPDLLHGIQLTQDGQPIPNFGEVLGSVKWEQTRRDIFEILVPYMRSKGVTSFGIVGFCWGPRVVARACAENETFSAGVNFHPSWEAFDMHGDKPFELAERIKAAQLYCTAGNDNQNFKNGGQFTDILRKNLGDKLELVDYPNMKHGWVSRTPMNEPEIVKEAADAIERGLAFFKKYL